MCNVWSCFLMLCITFWTDATYAYDQVQIKETPCSLSKTMLASICSGCKSMSMIVSMIVLSYSQLAPQVVLDILIVDFSGVSNVNIPEYYMFFLTYIYCIFFFISITVSQLHHCYWAEQRILCPTLEPPEWKPEPLLTLTRTIAHAGWGE